MSHPTFELSWGWVGVVTKEKIDENSSPNSTLLSVNHLNGDQLQCQRSCQYIPYNYVQLMNIFMLIIKYLINGNLKILLSENYITCCLIFVPPYTVLFTLCTTSQWIVVLGSLVGLYGQDAWTDSEVDTIYPPGRLEM